MRVCGTGKESGIAVEARIAHLFTFKDGLVVRVESYEDRDEALRAAGLEAEAGCRPPGSARGAISASFRMPWRQSCAFPDAKR